MVPFVDISKHQGAVDFRQMAANHVAGVLIRAGNGVKVDPLLAPYMLGAKAAGLKVGVYWFCNPRVGSAAQQGSMLAAAHNAWACDLPPMLDVESYANETGLPANDLKGPAYASWLRLMAATCDKATERESMIYTNAAYWNPNVGATDFGHRDLVCARYPFYSPAACAANVPPLDARDWDEWLFAATPKRPQVPAGWSTWQAWQFSAGYNGRGPAYGCASADLDLNVARDDVWQRWTNTTPTPIPTEDDDMQSRIPNEVVYDSRDGAPKTAHEVRFMATKVGVNIQILPAFGQAGYAYVWGAGAKPAASDLAWGKDGIGCVYVPVTLEPGTGALRIECSTPAHVLVNWREFA